MTDDVMESPRPEDRLEVLARALDSGSASQARRLLASLNEAETAHLLESLPPDHRVVLWELIPCEERGEVLLYLSDDLRNRLIGEMETRELVAATAGLDVDDLADLVSDLPSALISEVLRSMDAQDRRRLESVLPYDEDSAGGLMNLDTVTVRADVNLDVVLRYLRLRGHLPTLTDSLFVVDRQEHYLGLLPLGKLLTSDPDLSVAAVMETGFEGIPAKLPAADVSRRFQDHDLVSAPVVNAEGRLLGRITVDDVVDVIRDQADHSIMSMAGLDEEDDAFGPVSEAVRGRVIWLAVNLATAFLASWVIGQFEATLEQVVALAVLMPVVASMGGIAGSQTLTLMVRGLALGRISDATAPWLLRKELAVGLVNGVLWAVVVGIVAMLWFDNGILAVVIGIAMLVNLLFAALSGFLIPLLLRRVGVDPALAGGVLLTTVTDVVGFVAFLGLGTWLLL